MDREGRVVSICTSPETGTVKRPVKRAVLAEDHGIEGDAHAGDWHRQVSILALDDFRKVEAVIPGLEYGAFAENIVVEGLDLADAGLGTRLRLGGEAILRITQIGKTCHEPCHIGRRTGACVLPARGLFARVVRGGDIEEGDGVEIVKAVSRSTIQIVVLTVSDRCSRGEAVDTAGPAAAALLCERLDAHLYGREVLPDEHDRIADRLRHYCDGHTIDLVVTVGGTGMTPRDVTPEATRGVLERMTPGLDEAMRRASLAKTPHAMLSRGVSGIRNSTLVVNVPGSHKGAVENLEAIVDALPHGIDKLRGSPEDCG